MAPDPTIHLDLPVGATSVDTFTTPRAEPLLYPGTRPTWSYCFIGARILPIECSADGLRVIGEDGRSADLDRFLRERTGTALDERYAVLAIGSNACPARLADPDKYGGQDPVAIPVLRGWVDDVVSVYCAWRAAYGSVPATIAGHPGARSHVWVTLLTADEVERMDTSEGRGSHYELIEMPAQRVLLGDGEAIGPLHAYFEPTGLAGPDGHPVRLACFQAEGDTLGALDQEAAQRHLAEHGQAPVRLAMPPGAREIPSGHAPSVRATRRPS